MHPELDIEEALQRDDLVFIDVRTPSEFGRASIPGAVNIPLFDDRQFRELGAIYRNRGEKAARLAGLALAAPKLPELVEQIRTASGAKTPLIYCWRGGLRSLSLYQILNLAGVPALRLRGGYRAFRRYVNARLRDFSLQSEILVLHGLTGVGKTALIRALARKGYAALDLEGLARHRGSVFGAVGIQPRSQRDFEALLLQKLQRFKDSPYLVLEGEGKRIGNIHLPPFLTRAMEEGKHLLLTAPLPVRVERILEDYLAIPPSPEVVEEIREALVSLRRRLGAGKVELLCSLLEAEEYHQVAEILCTDYYDRLYNDARPESRPFFKVVDCTNLDLALEEMARLIEERYAAYPLADGKECAQ